MKDCRRLQNEEVTKDTASKNIWMMLEVEGGNICDGDNEEHQPMLLAKMFFKNCWSDLPKPPINETKPDVML